MTRVRGALSVALCLSAAGCSEGSSEYFGSIDRHGRAADTIVINNVSEPEYLDPGKSADSASGVIVSQLFEGLTIFDPRDMHPTAGQATRFERSADNRLYRFHLRENAEWSDGKPVTAEDFVYAWKRALRPSTASTAATALYPLMNGELFNLGRLKVLKEAASLASAPEDGATSIAALEKGAAVTILGRSPAVVGVQVAPLASPRAGAKNVSVTKAKVDELSFDDGAPAIKSSDAGWKGAEVVVLSAGPRVLCNGESDRWFEVRRGKDHGFLPGCALGAAKSKHVFAMVQRHALLPTFMPRASLPSVDDAGEVGFVPEDLLIEDDALVGVRATDAHTIEVELGQPTPYFLDLTSLPTLAPVRKDVVEPFEKRGEPDLWTRPENIVTNGPYTIASWRFRDEIVLGENKHYWNRDKVKTKKVVYLEIEDSRSGQNLYKAGDLDFSGDSASLPVDYLPFLKDKKDFKRFPFLSTYWYELNVKVPPLDDVRVRRALDLAIDKKQIVEQVTQGGQQPATHFVPDSTGLGYAKEVEEEDKAGTDPFRGPEVEFNPSRARALLAEAGFRVEKDGDGYRAAGFPSLEVLYNTSEGHQKIAVAIQSMWKQNLGISVRLRNEEWKVLSKDLRDGNFQIARNGWVADYNHPNTWLETFLSTNPQNRAHWVSQEFDDALHAAGKITDEKESIRAYRLAEKIAVDAMPRIPVYFYTRSFLVKPWLKGWYGQVHGSHLAEFMWIDDDWRHDNVDSPAFEPEPLPEPSDYEPPGAP